jgi:cell division protein FtsB
MEEVQANKKMRVSIKKQLTQTRLTSKLASIDYALLSAKNSLQENLSQLRDIRVRKITSADTEVKAELQTLLDEIQSDINRLQLEIDTLKNDHATTSNEALQLEAKATVDQDATPARSNLSSGARRGGILSGTGRTRLFNSAMRRNNSNDDDDNESD